MRPPSPAQQKAEIEAWRARRDRAVIRARRRREGMWVLLGIGTPIVIVGLLVLLGWLVR